MNLALAHFLQSPGVASPYQLLRPCFTSRDLRCKMHSIEIGESTRKGEGLAGWEGSGMQLSKLTLF